MANVRCAEIRDDQIRNLVGDQAWKLLAEASAQTGAVVPGLGPALHGLVDRCVEGSCQGSSWGNSNGIAGIIHTCSH